MFRSEPLSARWHANTRLRLYLCALLMMMGLGALACRLWDVQVLSLVYYTSELHSNSDVRVRIPPVRGEIRDRNGIVLAENRSAFDIELDLPEIVRAYRERHGQVPTLQYQTTIRQMPKMLTEPDIVQIVNTDVIPRLRELGLPADYDPTELERHFRVDTELPFVLAKERRLQDGRGV